jgi:hypothetical protein
MKPSGVGGAFRRHTEVVEIFKNVDDVDRQVLAAFVFIPPLALPRVVELSGVGIEGDRIGVSGWLGRPFASTSR